jgi:hypothetical protein
MMSWDALVTIDVFGDPDLAMRTAQASLVPEPPTLAETGRDTILETEELSR